MFIKLAVAGALASFYAEPLIMRVHRDPAGVESRTRVDLTRDRGEEFLRELVLRLLEQIDSAL